MDVAFAFSVIFTGIVIVFLVLVVLIAIMEIMGRVLGSKPNTPSGGSSGKEAPQAAAAPAAPSPVIKKMEVEDGIGDEIVAVISAAIAALTGGAGKPTAIRRAKREKAAGRGSWSLAGLQENTQPF